ncbi:hypothetical protein AB1K70_15335 [Bremerella sp. JC770]|uniref:ABC transporter permease n=1 Tax=Bremerella sp. JC770 TaxID=3232137 RepID=UPI0034579EB0
MMATGSHVQVYRSDTGQRVGVWKSLAQLVSDVHSNWNLIQTKFIADFSRPYRRSRLGIFWAAYRPILPVSVYIILGVMGVFGSSEDELPRPLYIASGFLFYGLMSGVMTATASAVSGDRNLIIRLQIPPIISIVTRLGTALSDFLFRMLAMLAAMLVFTYGFSWNAWTAILLLIPMLMLAVGIGMLASLLDALSSDASQLLNSLLVYGVWASSVVVAMPTRGWLGVISRVNVLNIYVVEGRNLLFEGTVADPIGLTIAIAISVLVFLIGLTVFYRLQFVIRDYL